MKTNKAILLTDAAQLAAELGWQTAPVKRKAQRELFITLSDEEEKIAAALKEKDAVHIDELYLKSGLSSSEAAAAVLKLELQNIVTSLPGKMYKLA